MPQRDQFTHKLLQRLDRIDQNSIQHYVTQITEENSIYHRMLEELAEGIVLISKDRSIRFVNRQGASWLGVPAGKDAGIFLSDCLTDSNLKRFITKSLSALGTDRIVEDIDILIPRNLSLRVALAPIKTATQKYSLLLMADISRDRARLFGEDQIARIEALVSLASGIAHEIGNPLNAIAIHLELMHKYIGALPKQKQAPIKKTLEVLRSETSRLDQIIRNFLKATRKTPVRFKHEDLNLVIERALQVMKPEFKARKIQMKLSQDKKMPHFLLDSERIYQAIINLAKNSIEAMPKGGVFTVSLLHRANVAILKVKDTGNGIPDEVVPHIFEIYYTTKKEGSGLGLMSVFQAIRDHGGRIEVASKVGKGTSFTILLPIRKPQLQLPNY